MVLTRQSSIFNNNGEGHSESGTFSKSKTLLVSLDPQQPSTSNALVVVRAGLNLLDLPQEILDKIFSYTGYKTAAHLRVVSSSKQSNPALVSIYLLTYSNSNTLSSRYEIMFEYTFLLNNTNSKNIYNNYYLSNL